MKTKRKIIRIDEEKCTGCGQCIPNCPEGALQIIDGKARLVSDLFCDGLGACVGTCPEGALTVEERPAEPYDEKLVMANIVKAGKNTIIAHLKHLREHGAETYYQQAVEYLKEHNIRVPEEPEEVPACGCPGAQMRVIKPTADVADVAGVSHQPSRLVNWPIQIMLAPVFAPYFAGAELLIAADCTGFASPDFQEKFLKGKVVLVGCPKLDNAQFYQEKLTEIFKRNGIRSVTCLHMEVPCCYGLVQIVQQALADSGKKIAFKDITVKITGEVKE